MRYPFMNLKCYKSAIHCYFPYPTCLEGHAPGRRAEGETDRGMNELPESWQLVKADKAEIRQSSSRKQPVEIMLNHFGAD